MAAWDKDPLVSATKPAWESDPVVGAAPAMPKPKVDKAGVATGMGEGLGDTERALVSLGSGMHSGAQGIGELARGVLSKSFGPHGAALADKLGLSTPQDVAETRKTEYALPQSGWDKALQFGGSMLPTAGLPVGTGAKALGALGAGANVAKIGGALGGIGLQGAAMPVAPGESRGENVAGAYAGAGILHSLGAGASKLGGSLGKGLQLPELKQEGIQELRQAGYKADPVRASANWVNQALHFLAGDKAMSASLSKKNVPVTSSNIAETLGLKGIGEKNVTPEALNKLNEHVRESVYEPIRKLGGTLKPSGELVDTLLSNDMPQLKKMFDVTPDWVAASKGKSFEGVAPTKYKTNVAGQRVVDDAAPSTTHVRTPGSPGYTPVRSIGKVPVGSAIDKIKDLREYARMASRNYGTKDAVAARAEKDGYLAAANALEESLEQHLESIGRPEMLNAFREGRKTIAQSHDVWDALENMSGDVSATKLLAKAKDAVPGAKQQGLTGGLAAAAKAADLMPEATRDVGSMLDAPEVSRLGKPMAAFLTSDMFQSPNNPLMKPGMGFAGAPGSAQTAQFLQLLQAMQAQLQSGATRAGAQAGAQLQRPPVR